MNSQRARNYIVSAALVVAVLFFHPSLFAQLFINEKTPGSAFSVVGTKGTAADIAGGRQFRGVGFQQMKIQGLTSRAGIRLRRFSNPPAAATGNPLSHQPVRSFVAVR